MTSKGHTGNSHQLFLVGEIHCSPLKVKFMLTYSEFINVVFNELEMQIFRNV